MTRHGAGVEIVVHGGEAHAPPSQSIEGKPLDAWREEARSILCLPPGSVFATGHQSECWHAGILAKSLWVQAVARRERALSVHVVVDQDGFDGMPLEWPFLRADGWWGVRGHRFAPAAESSAAIACAAFRPRPVDPGEGVDPRVAAGVQAVHDALRQHLDASSAAMQGALAMLDLAGTWLERPMLVRASDLMRTGLARRLLERMLGEPETCARHFNASLRHAPRAARALHVRGADSELPVWLLGPDGARLRASARELEGALARGETILPRAFLMSAIARTALADRFTHGLGGGVYEQATDRWMREWLGWAPPPHDVVSASLRLELPMPPEPARSAIPWRRAWCDPDLLESGGTGPSIARRRALELIASIPPRDPRRRAAYRDLVNERNSGRLLRSGELDALRGAEEAAGAARVARELAARRTWCFALLDPRRVTALRDALEARANA
jgi:hypothetical protein